MGMKLSHFIISDETTSKTADWQQMRFQLQAFWSPDEFRAWLRDAYCKFRIFERTAGCSDRRVLSVIQALCVLHNFICIWTVKSSGHTQRGVPQQPHNINSIWRLTRVCTNEQSIIKDRETPIFCGEMFTTERYMTLYSESSSYRTVVNMSSCRSQRAWSHFKQKADTYLTFRWLAIVINTYNKTN